MRDDQSDWMRRALERRMAEGDLQSQPVQPTGLNAQAEIARLRAENDALRSELQRGNARARELEAQLGEVRADNMQHQQDNYDLQQKINELSNLYVATHQLNQAGEREAVVQAIHEIVSHLIGADQHAIFEVAGDKAVLRLVSAEGVPEGRFSSVALYGTVIGEAVRAGSLYVDATPPRYSMPPDVPQITACIPLRLGDTTIGAIVIFSLLYQKTGLADLDYKLFELLSTHAASALRLADAMRVH